MNRTLPGSAGDVALLIARLLLGTIMFAHGYQKLMIDGLGRTTEGFESMSIPVAIFSAAFVTVVEIVGGVLVILGALLTVVAACYLVVMVGAAVFVHIPNGIFVGNNGWELVGAIAALLLALAAAGSGRYGLDHLIRRWQAGAPAVPAPAASSPAASSPAVSTAVTSTAGQPAAATPPPAPPAMAPHEHAHLATIFTQVVPTVDADDPTPPDPVRAVAEPAPAPPARPPSAAAPVLDPHPIPGVLITHIVSGKPTSAALRHVTAIRYVTPLREGGSLPGLMECDDLGTYVVKFSGAGQGVPVLVAEIISGELARGLGLRVPELVTVELDPTLGASEPDQEVQDLLRRSPGRNLGLDFLPGALDLDPTAFPVDRAFAGRVLWFDALVGNVDRSWRNVNMLRWHGDPYLIDHGATLTFHHSWSGPEPPAVVAAGATRPYDATAHVLLGASPDLDAADAALAPRVTGGLVRAAVERVPDDWLQVPGFADVAQVRDAYVTRLLARRDAREVWLAGVREAVAARTRVCRGRGAMP